VHYDTPGHAHALTFSCYDHRPYFCGPSVYRAFLSEIRTAQEEFRFHVWAYVVMPDHVHLLIWPLESAYSIAAIEQAMKGRMSFKYSQVLQATDPERHQSMLVHARNTKRFRFWQHGGGFDRNLWNPDRIYTMIRYIEANPVRAGLVGRREKWPWSSASSVDRGDDCRPIVDRSSLPVRM
jgi:putative transposase